MDKREIQVGNRLRYRMINSSGVEYLPFTWRETLWGLAEIKIVDLDSVFGIDVTPEILGKMGFAQSDDSWVIPVDERGTCLEWRDECMWLMRNQISILLPCKHVHHVQNLYRSFSHNELVYEG